MRVEPREDGAYRIFNRELAFYTDPRTGEYVDTWTNPFSGEECEVSPIHNLVVNAEVAPIMKMDFDGTMVEVPFSPPWILRGERAFNTFEIHTAYPNPMDPAVWPRESAGPISRVSEIFQRYGRLADLEDPDATEADYAGSWTRVGPWLPWMRQGQASGHILYRTFIERTGRPENLPEKLVARTEERFPEYFQAPGPETWGQHNDSSWSVYMAEHEPLPTLEPTDDEG